MLLVSAWRTAYAVARRLGRARELAVAVGTGAACLSVTSFGGAAHASVSPPPTSWPAGSAISGKALFPITCESSGCHTGTSSATDQQRRISEGANSPTTINNGILFGSMTNAVLRALTAQQIADIAAYLGNPNVSSSAVATLSNNSLDFASTAIGSTSGFATLTLSNTGGAPLVIATISSSDGAVFAVTGGSCSAGAAVAAGASCMITLAFSPTTAGNASGNLTIAHDGSGGQSTVTLSGTGVSPTSAVAAVTPSSLVFSQVANTSSATQLVNLSNTGSSNLQINGVTLTGAQASDYVTSSGTTACGTSLAAGASCNFAIGFTPTAIGARKATLSIAHNAAGSPATVALKGTGTTTPQPLVSVNGNALSFGPLAVGSTATQSLTLTNSGQVALQITALALSGGNPADFTPGGGCAIGASIAPGQTCDLTMRFAPGALGSRAATLTIGSNAPAVSIGLSGSATAAPTPVASFGPTAEDFGTAQVGAAAVTRNLILTNTGDGSLTIASILASGSGFSATHNCGTRVAPAASCTVAIAFAPPAAMTYHGLITLNSNVGAPHTVALTGIGSATAVPLLAWSSSVSGTYPNTLVGSVSSPVTFILTNHGPGNATLNSVGASTGEYTLSGTCVAGISLPANVSCSVNVAFAPAGAGVRSASVMVKSSGTDPDAIALNGRGVMPAQAALTLSTHALAFPTVAVNGTGSTLSVTAHNTGTVPIQLDSVTSSSGLFVASSACGTLPVMLAPGQSCALQVAMAAGVSSTVRALADTLTIASSDTSSPGTVQVSGTVATSVTSSTNVGAGAMSDGFSLLCGAAVLGLLGLQRRPTKERL